MLSLDEAGLREGSRAASLAALALFLRRPAPTGTLRSVPPAVQYLWQPCRKDTGVGGRLLKCLLPKGRAAGLRTIAGLHYVLPITLLEPFAYHLHPCR